MKATELRIGNLVNRINRNNEVHLPDGITYVVQEIGFDCVIYPLGKNPATLSQMPIAYHNDLSPISLTDEWLLKLGFNKDYKLGYIGIDVSNTDFVLTYPEVMGEWQKSFAYQWESGNIAMFKEIEYVHQLQNLFFSLTETELSLAKNKTETNHSLETES